MNLKKIFMKLTGRQEEPQVNRVQVDINYVQSCVDSDKFYSSSETKDIVKEQEKVT